MTAVQVKICGVNTLDALDAALAARVDYVGLNFVPGSVRAVALDKAAALGRQAAGRTLKVGLFLDADDRTIAEAVDAAGLDILQLHGSESPQRTAELRARFALPTWKALPVAAADDLRRADAYAGAADLVLFDAKTPRGSLPGGQGLRFDWTLLQGWKAPLAWGLAGGLDPANVAEAIRLTGATLVDTASGVESSPGVKDAGLIAAFCAAAQAA